MNLDDWLAEGEPLAPLHLRDLSRSRPIRSWSELTWDYGCDYCAHSRYAPSSVWMWDGDSAVCVDCGLVSQVSCDGESGAHIQDAHGLLVPAALAGLRRLLGITPHHWRTP